MRKALLAQDLQGWRPDVVDLGDPSEGQHPYLRLVSAHRVRLGYENQRRCLDPKVSTRPGLSGRALIQR